MKIDQLTWTDLKGVSRTGPGVCRYGHYTIFATNEKVRERKGTDATFWGFKSSFKFECWAYSLEEAKQLCEEHHFGGEEPVDYERVEMYWATRTEKQLARMFKEGRKRLGKDRIASSNRIEKATREYCAEMKAKHNL